MAYTIIFKSEDEIVKTKEVNGKWINALDVLEDTARYYEKSGLKIQQLGSFPINPNRPYLGSRMTSFSVVTKIRTLVVYIKRVEE